MKLSVLMARKSVCINYMILKRMEEGRVWVFFFFFVEDFYCVYIRKGYVNRSIGIWKIWKAASGLLELDLQVLCNIFPALREGVCF